MDQSGWTYRMGGVRRRCDDRRVTVERGHHSPGGYVVESTYTVNVDRALDRAPEYRRLTPDRVADALAGALVRDGAAFCLPGALDDIARSWLTLPAFLAVVP